MRVGIIGGGLMGREAAACFGRWFALTDVPERAELVDRCYWDQPVSLTGETLKIGKDKFVADEVPHQRHALPIVCL